MAASRAKPRATASRVGYSRRNRLDKLAVKEGMRVAILGVDDAFIRRALAQRTIDVSRSYWRPWGCMASSPWWSVSGRTRSESECRSEPGAAMSCAQCFAPLCGWWL
jgi:hypothetical protein